MSESFLSLMVNQAGQIAALTIVVALIVRIAARNRPHLAHALWMLVLFKCVAPPLWGHSLGVFSQLLAWTTPAEVLPSVDTHDDVARVEAVRTIDLVPWEDSVQPLLPDDSEEIISDWEGDADVSFDAETQEHRVAEEAQTDFASLRLSDPAPEIPLLQSEEEIRAAEQPSSFVIDKLPTILFGGLIVGAIVTLMTMVIRCLRCLRQIRLHRTTEFDGVLRERLQILAKQLGVHRVPNIIVSNVLFGPAVLGLLRHTIVLPRCLFEGGDSSASVLPERTVSGRSFLPDRTSQPVATSDQSGSIDEQNGDVERTTAPHAVRLTAKVLPGREDLLNLEFLDPILAHELLHIRRGDLRTGTLQAIVQSLWWFHPAVWFCNRWLSREAERCCDEQVIAELGCTPAHYARSLLSVIECKHRLQPIPVFPGMKPVEITSQRMERIMSLRNGLKKRTPLWCWLMIVALAFVVLPGAVAKTSIDEVATNETNEAPELPEKDDVTALIPEFEGNVFWSDTDLLKHLSEREQANDVDTATTLAADSESIKAKYCDVGFFDVEVTATTSPVEDPAHRRVQFEVNEGRRYKIREIRYEGNKRISANDLQKGSSLKAGKMYGSYPISKDIQRIRELYKELNLDPPNINPVPQFLEEHGVVDVVFEIDEESAAKVSRKIYDVGDLLTRLADDLKVSTKDARTFLISIIEKAAPPVMEVPQGFPALPRVAAAPARPSLPAPPAPKQRSSVSLDGEQLVVVQTDLGHLKLQEEMDRFRKFGFKRFQVTARFIMGSAEEIDALMSSMKMEAPFSSITEAPVRATQHNATDDANHGQSAVTTIHMGATGIVSRDRAREIEELARSKTNSFTIECPQVQSFNGQTAMTHVGEMKPYIVGFNENDAPMIRTVIDGMTLHVTPTVLDDGLLRLQCMTELEGIIRTQTVSVSRSAGSSPKRILVPAITSKRVQTTVELKDDQTLLLSGLTTSHDGKSQAVLVVLEVTLISSPNSVVDQPLLDGIKYEVDPNTSSGPVGKEEVVLTAKPKVQPVAAAPESTPLRVPALPLPEWIRKSSDPLVKLVWDARNASQRRLLMTDQRNPWFFKQGLAALRREFLIREGNEAVVGLDWLQNAPGVQLDHYRYRGSWFQKTEHGAQPDPGSVEFGFEDHAQEFVATLALNDVPVDTKFKTDVGMITMSDMIKHLQMTVSEKKQTPWTLIALSKYLPRNEKWTNANGEQWSIERLVRMELDKPKHIATPRSLMSLAVARNHYFQAGETLAGIWLQADQRILAAIEESRPSQRSDGRIVTTYTPAFQSPRFQYRSKFGPPVSAQRMAPNDIDRVRMDLEGNRRFHLAAFPTDIESMNRAQMLLFLTIAIPENRLGEDWIRRELEIAANDLVADWSNPEIQSPFYETTQALTVYLERFPKYLEYVDEAGLSPVLAGNARVQVRVKGMVRQPSSYEYVGNNNLRLLEVITRAGGTQDESADTVSVVRKVGKQPQPAIFQVNLKRLKSGADPNFYVMPGDEVLVQTADFVKMPLAASIRLDDKFVLSPETSFTGSMVIAFVNDEPITVEEIMGSAWERLQKTPEAAESVKHQITCEWIASRLPDFAYQELVLQHFQVDALEPAEEISPKHRELTDQMFVDALEKTRNPGTTDDERRRIARNLGAGLSRGSSLEDIQKKKQVDAYLKGLSNNSVEKANAAVTKHVQELVTIARLRPLVSLNYTNTSLTEVVRSVEEVYGIDIKVNSLHAQIAPRIFDRPGAVDFHSENKPLGEALTAIAAPFGLTLSLDGSDVRLQFANSEEAMEKFRSLPGPPSFGVFGILKNSGWHPLKKEIRLLDAITLAGGIADTEGVSIEITNPEIISGKAIPVSMSLQVLQSDASGKLNRIVKDGDMISVTRNGSSDALPAKESGARVINGKGVNSDAGLVSTVRFQQPLNDGNNAASSEAKGHAAGRRYDGPPTPKGPGRMPKLDSPDKLLVPERPMPPEIRQSSDSLVKLVWEARESSRRRLLTTDEQTPWQLMHGVLGLRQDFLVKHDGKIINGLEWIQSGPTFKDEPPYQEDQPWFQKTKHGGRAHPYLRPYLFEGHINQFAASLASCQLPLNAQFGTPDGPITMQDLITNAQMTANQKEEVSWTLSLLSRYLPPDAKWMNAKGEEWSIERLVKVEVGKDLPRAPCGGTCGLFALAVARSEYLRSGKPLKGVWLEAEQKIQKYVELARVQQNADGTLSSNYFRGCEYKQDFDKRLASSGALLQFLLTAASDEQLKEDWLRRAVEATANDLMTNRKVFVSCAPLFETTNALSIYLDRVAMREVTDVQPESKEIPVAERLVLCCYPVADLVVYRRAMIDAGSQAAEKSDTGQMVPPAALALVPEKTAAEPQSRPTKESQNMQVVGTGHADFAPLTELIKATVQPESWASPGSATISIDKESLSLVIRQTQAAHEEIADLLPQLRNAQDQMVSIRGRIFELTDGVQSRWLEDQVSLHALQNGTRWALLSQQRSETFALSLREQKPSVLSAPQVMTISGQTATIQIGSTVTGENAATGIRLEMTPHLLPDSNVIRLQHSFSIGEFANEMPGPIESLVGSGQTLLLLIDDPEDNEKNDAARSQYLLMMTPEHIPQIEEEEAVSGATPRDAARSVEPTDSPDK